MHMLNLSLSVSRSRPIFLAHRPDSSLTRGAVSRHPGCALNLHVAFALPLGNSMPWWKPGRPFGRLDDSPNHSMPAEHNEAHTTSSGLKTKTSWLTHAYSFRLDLRIWHRNIEEVQILPLTRHPIDHACPSPLYGLETLDA